MQHYEYDYWKEYEIDQLRKTPTSGATPWWQKLIFFIILSCLVLVALVGIFILFMLILRPLRNYMPIVYIPWIFASVYAVAVIIVFFALKLLYNQVKNNNKWNKYFFKNQSKV